MRARACLGQPTVTEVSWVPIAMFCGVLEREELEDELYGEAEDSVGSEVDSELEFRLYSQLHYSAGERNEEEEEEEDRNTERQQRVKGHTERSQNAKQKKQQQPVRVKGRGASPEVIVLDSGTDVITLSDSDADDGVCHSKGQRSTAQPRPLQASTPAQQPHQKRRRSPSLDSVVVLDSQESESESGSSSGSGSGSESESSEGLESWMILGREKQQEDHSIQLNLEGGVHSSAESYVEDGVWDVSDRDRDAQIFNRAKGEPWRCRTPKRYYTEKSVTCRSCCKTGHLSKNCPTPRKEPCCVLCGEPGHFQRDCPSRHCNNCGLPGHLYEACSDRYYWQKHCHRCGMTGHFQDACPEIWRQYHLTTKAGPPQKLVEKDQGRNPPYCSNCSKKGHLNHDCSQRRMFNGTYPSTTFIHHYDTRDDMRRRDHRLKHRVEELKEAGLFPTDSRAPPTPHGPPKKKQKTNHSGYHTPKSDGSPHQNNKPVRIPNFSRTPGPLATPRKPGQAKTWTPKSKMADQQKGKQQKVVPKVKMAAANTTPTAIPKVNILDLDEACDFPRGGSQKKKNQTKNKTKKGLVPGGTLSFSTTPASSGAPGHSFLPPVRLLGAEKAGEAKGKKKRPRGRDRKPANMAANKMYPTDENLFIIKQRKRKR